MLIAFSFMPNEQFTLAEIQNFFVFERERERELTFMFHGHINVHQILINLLNFLLSFIILQGEDFAWAR